MKLYDFKNLVCGLSGLGPAGGMWTYDLGFFEIPCYGPGQSRSTNNREYYSACGNIFLKSSVALQR